MSLTNKRFKNNFTGDVVSVIDSFEHIAILEDKQKIDSGVLLNTNLYTEVGLNESAGSNNADIIDPSTFFQSQNSYDQLASKIKNIDSSHIVDDGVPNTNVSLPKQSFDVSNESAIIMADEDDERAKLMAKYGAMDNNQSLNSQHDAFAKILGEDADLPEVERVYNPPIQQQEQRFDQVERFEVDRDLNHNKAIRKEEDPIVKLFQGVKRSVNFSMNIEIDGKIPRIDFIEMMEDSYEKSLIDFLAEEFTNKILDDPSTLNQKIKDTLMFMVYGEVKKEVKEEVKEKPKRKYTKKAKKEDKE